ncbi:tRNA pseudouridine(13) synthase TruD, partial [Salmonella sp. s51933]|uniref:tRNA pseudouridine(13) synthase TruD n=1 Tax=Salmonella sp. s51933 TaxID=3160127 RepID=UPI003753FDA2
DSEHTIKSTAVALGKHGFLNYFGLQRFGSGSVPSHVIGDTLLRGELKAAVSMILDPREGHEPDSEHTIKSTAVALGKHGFINYIGLQRCGSGSVPT